MAEKNNRKNQRYLFMLAGILLLFVMFTYISTQVYRHSLPIVETDKVTAGAAKPVYKMAGVFQYCDVREYEAPVPVRVEEVYVRAGEAVSEGMKLLKLDTEYLQIELLKLELQTEELRERLARIADEEENEKEAKLFAYELEEQEEKLLYVQELLEAEGMLLAEFRGEIREVCKKSSVPETAGKVLLSVCDRDGDAEITWSMKEEGKLFERMYVELRLTDGHAVETQTVILEDVTRRYDSKADKMFFTARVPETKKRSAMHDSETLTVTAYQTGEVYASLIPVSAVSYESDGSACVYELHSREKSFGTEYYVKKLVISVRDKDADYIATNTKLKDNTIIISSSKPLYDRAVVWVE